METWFTEAEEPIWKGVLVAVALGTTAIPVVEVDAVIVSDEVVDSVEVSEEVIDSVVVFDEVLVAVVFAVMVADTEGAELVTTEMAMVALADTGGIADADDKRADASERADDAADGNACSTIEIATDAWDKTSEIPAPTAA